MKPRTSASVYVQVNDIFDEMSAEIQRLTEELTFANNCLNVFNLCRISNKYRFGGQTRRESI